MTIVRQRIADLRYLRNHFGDLILEQRRFLVLASLALLGEVVLQLLAPFALKYIFDGLLIPRPDARLVGVPVGYPQEHPLVFLGIACGAMLLLPVGAAFFAYSRTICSASAGQRMVTQLRKRLYSHLHYLSLRFHRENRLGDLILRLSGDVPMLRDVLSESFIDLLGRLGTVAITLAVLVALDPYLAIISAVVLVVVATLSGVFTRRIARVAKKQRRQEGFLAYTAGETLTALSLVKALGREEDVVRRFARENRTSMRKGLAATRLQAALSRWVEIAFAIGIATVVLFGVLRILSGGGLTAGDLLVFAALVKNLNKPLRKISRISGRIGKAAACGQRILEVLNIEPEEIDLPDARPAPALTGAIRLDRVRFAYEDGPTVLDGIDLTVGAGERIALVGSNGAGKTTLSHLLLRFYEPTEGRILMDGADVRQYTIKSLRDQASVVLQGTYLFGSSIRDNLLFSAPDADDETMLAALDTVCASFVRRLPAGLDTELAEGGKNLSGGERRKLALAGAILRRTPLLILDEPTTHMDSGSRDDIIGSLPRVVAGRTTLLITHDPAMLRWVDRVVYLENGRIVAEGNHRDLQEESSGYQALFPRGLPAAEGNES